MKDYTEINKIIMLKIILFVFCERQMREFFLFVGSFFFERQEWVCIWMRAKVEGTGRNRWRRNHNQYILIRKKSISQK